MSFENQIQLWVQIDNQLKLLNEKTKELRDKRNALEEKITDHAFSNNISDAIKISDGRLKFVNTKVQEPITFKYLEKTLSGIIKNESQVKLILEHIKQNRSQKIVQEIKRFSNN
jgi:hypothetical protein